MLDIYLYVCILNIYNIQFVVPIKGYYLGNCQLMPNPATLLGSPRSAPVAPSPTPPTGRPPERVPFEKCGPVRAFFNDGMESSER